MDHEFQEIEGALRGLRPAAPDDACMERLLMAVEGRLQVPSAAMAAAEQELAGMRPAALSFGVARDLLDTVSRVPFPIDEKVVLFPGPNKPGTKGRVRRRPWFAAAAAVAVAGAFTALMVDTSVVPPAAPVVEKVIEAPLGKGPAGFMPASAGSGLQDAKDEGVTWTPDGKAVRMVRVIFMDRVRYQNKQGEIIEVERPRVEYLMVPENID